MEVYCAKACVPLLISAHPYLQSTIFTRPSLLLFCLQSCQRVPQILRSFGDRLGRLVLVVLLHPFSQRFESALMNLVKEREVALLGSALASVSGFMLRNWQRLL